MLTLTRIEKCKGAMLGTAIGDALGWPNEPRSKNKIKKTNTMDFFTEWTRSYSRPYWYNEKILPGEYSDDTQLTLSVARSIIMGDWEKFFAEKELPFWLNYERGGGGALLKAAKSYEKGVLPWQSKYNKDYFNAGGNGAVMRILPHVIAYSQKSDITELIVDIIKDTLITHGHPRAFLGATCYAYALDYLLRKDTTLEYGELVSAIIDGRDIWGKTPNYDIFENWLNVAKQCCDYNFFKEWENTHISMLRQLENIKIYLEKGLIVDDTEMLINLGCFSKESGAGDVSILAAIYLASKYANNPYLGIKVPAFLFGADTDTIASITGGLLGMLSGTKWIPMEWKKVQDYNCLIQMTELLMAEDKKEATKKEVAEVKLQNSRWNITPIGKMRLIESKKITNDNNYVILISKWKTSLGQTIYIKNIDFKEISNKYYECIGNIPLNHKDKISLHQKNITKLKDSKQFVLSLVDIVDLLDDPKFKKNITIGKVLKIIETLIDDKETTINIAKKFNVDKSFVEQIEKYVINL